MSTKEDRERNKKIKDSLQDLLPDSKKGKKLKKKIGCDPIDKKLVNSVIRSLNSASKLYEESEEDKLNDAKDNMNNARKIYEQAPKNLRIAEEKYHNLHGEINNNENAYNNFQVTRVNEILKYRLEGFDKDFNNLINILKTIETETQPEKIEKLKSFLNDLKNMYQSGSTASDSVKIRDRMKLSIAERMSHYSEKDIYYFRMYNVLLHLFCIVFMTVYIGYNVYFKSNFPLSMIPILIIYSIILIIYFMTSDRGILHYINQYNPSLSERFRNNVTYIYLQLKTFSKNNRAIPIIILCAIFAFFGYMYGIKKKVPIND